mgnify:CR=1 FL=1
MIETIAIQTAFTLFLCAFFVFFQIYMTKILINNVNNRITQLDSNKSNIPRDPDGKFKIIEELK